MPKGHQFGEPVLVGEILPDQRDGGTDPESHVGGEFVGKRQRTYRICGQNDTIQYRVGLNERHHIVVDRIFLDRFFQSPAPTRVELSEVPEQVQAEAEALLAEHPLGATKKPKGKPKKSRAASAN